AIGAVGEPVVRILVVSPSQIPVEIAVANTMRPRVVSEKREILAETMLHRNKQAVIVRRAAVIRQSHLAEILPLRWILKIQEPARRGVSRRGARPLPACAWNINGRV